MTMRATPLAITSIGLLAAWLGASLLVAAVVAPAAFAVLPTRTLAGALVGRVLPVIFWSGMALGVILALLGGRMGLGRFGLVSSVLLALASAAAQLIVSPRIEALRSSIGGAVDALDATDPRRMAFGRMHGISVLLMGIGMIAAAFALVVLARHLSARSIG
ncbi:MAG: hypothetical protein JWL61_873 [Gemmatimonadetes bacterium]|jgi:hypothetical protein|nr:hypothetical protein [Gemmatimonadota bacterium]